MRTAIYTRHATDQQAVALDQLAACHAIARRNNLEVLGTFTDAAASGADQSRAGLAALLTKAERHELEAVIVTDLDWLSRDTGHLITLWGLLCSFGVKVYTRGRRARARIDVPGLIKTKFGDAAMNPLHRAQACGRCRPLRRRVRPDTSCSHEAGGR